MDVPVVVLALVGTVVVVATLCRRFKLSAPLILTALGAAVSFLPFVPDVQLSPHLVLVGFLPPLLYAAAVNTSLVDLGRDRTAIIVLSVFLVLATALAVGLVAWSLLAAVPLAVALALGGVVAPPDAVAATAVARSIGLPRRIVSILEGESLFNDATALVIVNMSIAAFDHQVTPVDVGRSFLIAAVGGVVIGWVVAKLLRPIRMRVTHATTNVAISFMTPWLAYLPAESVHASGVIATVVCGVLLAHTAPTDETATARVAERMNWATVQFILENLVFLLIGLQVNTILKNVVDSSLGLGRTLIIALAVFATCLLIRPVWFLAWELIDRIRGYAGGLTAREGLVASWAGMRGVVTLAAASLLPIDAPERPALVFTALLVTVGTLVLQGFTLPSVARALNLHGPDPRDDALQYAQTLQFAVNAGRARLKERLADNPDVPRSIVQALVGQGDRRANLAWERLGRTNEDVETPSEIYARLRTDMLDAERAKVLKLRDSGVMDHVVITNIMGSLDVEESMIDRLGAVNRDLQDRLMLTAEQHAFECEHLEEAPFTTEPVHPEGCIECELEGLTWVNLRLCLTCGHVGCCDSSVGRHATKHYQKTGHPVMRSFEPGEAWRWCYVDELLG